MTSDRRLRFALLAAGALLAAIALVMTYPDTGRDDADLWWHLKYGQQVVERGTWDQAHDEWSWTPGDTSWRYVSWLSDAVLYLAYRAAGGPVGPIAVQSLLYLAVIATYLALTWRRRRSIDAFDFFLVVVTFLAIKLIAGLPKAENFTVLFFSLTTALYAHARITGRDRFWLLPVVFWLWMNSHGAVIVGFVLLGTFGVGETIARWTGAGLDQRSYVRLLGFSVTSVAAACVNPHGFLRVVDGVVSVVRDTGTMRDSGLSAMATHWSSLIPHSVFDGYAAACAWILVGMFATIVGIAVRAMRRGEAIDPTLLIGATGFFFMGMQMQRAALFLPLFFLMTAVVWLPGRHGDAVAAWTARRPRVSGPALVAVTLLCVGLHFTNGTPLKWGGSSYDYVYPVQASRFVRESDLPGPLFNDYVTGSYLTWDLVPARKVYLDPRYQPYDPAFLEDYVALVGAQTAAAFEERAARFGFRSAVIDHRNLPALCSELVRSPRWTLVFLGPVGAVFTRSDAVSPSTAAAIEANTDPMRFADVPDPLALASATNLVIDRRPDVVVDVAHVLRHDVPGYLLRRDAVANSMESYLRGRTWFDASRRQRTIDEVEELFAQALANDDLATARFVAAGYTLAVPDDDAMWFERACLESRTGHVEIAAYALDRALVAGFGDVDRIGTTDALASLRASDAFADVARRRGLDPAAASARGR